MTSKSSITFEGCLYTALRCDMQCTYMCYDQRRFCHVSLGPKRHHYHLEHLNEASYKCENV